MTKTLIQQAISLSDKLASIPWQAKESLTQKPQRVFVIGDPQTKREKLFSIFASHDLLDDNGLLRSNVALISIGDHFDYAAEPEEIRIESTRLLRWLAEHPTNQVQLLAGNHDLCRVMELAPLSDQEFQEAQQIAKKIKAAERRGEDISTAEGDFYRRYPSLPSPGVVVKDFLGFSEEQRALVQSLLLAGRFRLGLYAQTQSKQEALLTHASITYRELELLSLPRTASAKTIADTLNQKLSEAVDEVRQDWQSGKVNTPLSLAPTHVSGFAGQEGGGLLYHRPANPNRPDADKLWEFDPKMPRRFDPRNLPAGLLQVAGHTGHSKCLKSLGDWVDPSAHQVPHGGLRTLSATSHSAHYTLGIQEPKPNEATLYMIDIEINKELPHYPLLALESVEY